MTTIGLSHVNLRAHRELLDALKEFYCDVVGLHHGARPPLRGFGYWLYAGDQPILHLSEAEPDEERNTHMATTVDHFAFNCTDRSDVEETLRRKGFEYRTAVVLASDQVQLFIQDPAGNRVELSFAKSDS